jgi:hypothetical protein
VLYRERFAAYDRGMTYTLIFFAALIGGLLMYLLCTKDSKAQRIGEMLLFSSFLALLITVAPAAVAKLHG